MDTTTYEAKTATANEANNRQAAQASDKAHYATEDDINWDTWWGEYIDEAE